MANHSGLVELRAARSYPVVLLVSAVDRRIIPAVRFVSRLPFAEARALHVSVDPAETSRLINDWMTLALTWLPLHIREAPSGHIAGAIRAAIDDEADTFESVTMVLPELNVPRWWHPLLHRQSARHIASELQDVPGVTTVIVPFTLTDLSPAPPATGPGPAGGIGRHAVD